MKRRPRVKGGSMLARSMDSKDLHKTPYRLPTMTRADSPSHSLSVPFNTQIDQRPLHPELPYSMIKPRYWTGTNVHQAMIMPSPPPHFMAADPFDPIYKSLMKNRTDYSGRPAVDPSPTPADAFSRQATYPLLQKGASSSQLAHHPKNEFVAERSIHYPSPNGTSPSPEIWNASPIGMHSSPKWANAATGHDYSHYDNTFALPVRSLKSNHGVKMGGQGNEKVSQDFTVHCMAPYNWLKRKWGFQYRHNRYSSTVNVSYAQRSHHTTPGYLIHNAYNHRSRTLATE